MIDISLRTVVSILVFGFGTVWVLVNAYFVYPLVRRGFTVLTSDEDPYDHVTERSPFVEGFRFADIESLPTIDIMLPAYHEGNVIENAISSLREADYPQELVYINVLVEPDDDDTRDALTRLASTYEFREIVVPSEYPNQPNKPRAMNYAFDVTDGQVISIIDAEDIVSPDMFEKAVNALSRRGCDYAQGGLDMVNEDSGWKNTLFRGEYGYWHHVVLPAFYAADYPIALSGTTNFYYRQVLAEISEIRKRTFGVPWSAGEGNWLDSRDLAGQIPWDPRNVTEDFELGMLLWQHGYEIGLIDAVTAEESPTSFRQWIRQRTRWQKGKVYTLIQYLRRPPASLAQRVHVFGQSALPHLGPINILAVLSLPFVPLVFGYSYVGAESTILTVGLVCVFVFMSLQMYGYWVVSDVSPFSKPQRALVNLLTLPCYWVLLWIANVRALQQIYLGQLHWEKTEHEGLNVRETDLNVDTQ